jgi:rare lipoprotein A
LAAGAALLCGVAAADADEASATAATGARVQSSIVGISSYYGPGFHGRPTADGEIFDRNAITAANKTLPIPCYARVTNLVNRRSIIVRVNDRGPYVAGRVLDVSERVARLLAFNGGLSRVRIDYLGKAGPAGAGDQRALAASLRSGDEPLVAKAKPAADEGVTVAVRSAPALAYASSPRAPAAAALESVVRPKPAATPAPAPLALAAQLDASLRRLETALEAANQTARPPAVQAADAASPFGDLVVAPFKPVREASR